MLLAKNFQRVALTSKAGRLSALLQTKCLHASLLYPSLAAGSQFQARAFSGRYSDQNDEGYGDGNGSPQRYGGRDNYRSSRRDDNYNSQDRFQSRRGSDRGQQQDTEAEDYVSYSNKIQRLTYEDLNCDEVTTEVLDERSRNELAKNGINELFPVQKAAYKLFVDGEELIVKSRTGSGKTLAFLLPLQELLAQQNAERQDKLLAVILEPTRELAMQVAEQINKFSKLRSIVLFGGGSTKAHENMRQIGRQRPQIIVATPGRFIDLLENHGLRVDSSLYQILDEGDKMLDMGFQQDIIRIQRFMPDAQTMIFSATVPKYIQEIATKYMRNPIMLDLVGKDAMQMPDTISNEIILCKDFVAKQAFIKKFIEQNRDLKILIFAETKIEVKRYERHRYATFGCLQGDLEQNARLRILQEYKRPNSDMVLVATDVAARGLDIDDIDVVIQQSVNNVDAFIHRTGRTGRAGKSGRNIVLYETEREKKNMDFFTKIEKALKCNFTYSNVILDNTSSEAANAEARAKEEKRLNKLTYQLKINAEEPRVPKTELAEERVTQMMEWFTQLDAQSQQNFIFNTFSSKFMGEQLKSSESIGLLSLKETLKSYYVENVDRQVLNKLRIICSSKHCVYISTNEPGQILFDVPNNQHEVMDEIQEALLQNTEGETTMQEAFRVPDTLKEEFYRAMRSQGQMSGGSSSRRGGGYNGWDKSQSRRGQYERKDNWRSKSYNSDDGGRDQRSGGGFMGANRSSNYRR